MTVNETLDMINDCESEYEAFNIFIEPPDVDEDTDCDSGDEDGAGASLNNLSRRHLRAQCNITVRSPGGRQHLDSRSASDDDTSSSSDADNSEHKHSAAKRRKKIQQKDSKMGKWEKSDLKVDSETNFDTSCWIEERDLTPLKIFELFFDKDLLEYVRDMTNLCAQQKEVENFQVSVAEIKTVIGIIFVSGYNSLPRKKNVLGKSR
ncbi:PiggyBac transposable element-derived protein 2 [Plakobranchus ocellatus]|uniref:PiggyBac transposable element-derived protein 2 n=1 Tax=Plakobranchus ocellatus TaxID=259542 RepID=A0AAV3Y4A3_9GAST|nr:PiggyBac transposable element-derived protein 2 [Plakobranchus ocellatus]